MLDAEQAGDAGGECRNGSPPPLRGRVREGGVSKPSHIGVPPAPQGGGEIVRVPAHFCRLAMVRPGAMWSATVCTSTTTGPSWAKADATTAGASSRVRMV